MSAYRNAIDLTTQTIDKRARYYRNLVVAVVLTSLVSIGWATMTWSLSPLSGLLLIFPISILFFFMDARLLNQWRSQLFQSWSKKDIDFCGLSHAVNAIPILPKDTLQGMLATLPIADNISAEQVITSSTREAIAASIAADHINQSDALAFKVTGFAMVVGSLILSLALSIWLPLLGITVISILPLLQKWTRGWRLRKSSEKVLIAQQKPDFNQEKYAQFVAELNNP
jgi:hypothetical protein